MKRKIRFKSRFLTDPVSSDDIRRFASGVLANLYQDGSLRREDDCSFHIGCPAGWDRNVRERYREIFEKVGFPPVRIVTESRAALMSACQSKHLQVGYDILSKPMLVVDMAGDGLVHGSIWMNAETADGSYDFTPMLENLRPILSQYDLKYYNQETILGGTELGLHGYPRFNSPQEFGDATVGLGFNLVSTANNHSLDKDEEGILRSTAYWKKQTGVVMNQAME